MEQFDFDGAANRAQDWHDSEQAGYVTCSQCGISLTAEERLLSALFGTPPLCTVHADEEEENSNPSLMFNGKPLSEYIEEFE